MHMCVVKYMHVVQWDARLRSCVSLTLEFFFPQSFLILVRIAN